MANPRMNQFSVQSIVDLLLRHKRKIIVFPLAAIAFGLIVLMYFPRTYRSQAKLFMQIGRESVGIDPTANVGQTIMRQQSGRDDEIQSTLEVLRSRGVVGAAVDKLGPEVVLDQGGEDDGTGRTAISAVTDIVLAAPRAFVNWARSLDPITDRERAIMKVERSMEADAGRDSAVLVLTYDASNPQLAQQVCAALIEAYQFEHVRIHRKPESSPFFEEQRKLLQGQLDGVEDRLRQAKDELSLASIEGRRATLESQYSSVSLSRYQTEQLMEAATARIADYEGQLAKLPERLNTSNKSVPNQGADLLREQYYALQLKEMDLKARYSDNHPLVQTVAQQAAEAKRVLDELEESRMESTDETNPVHRELSLELMKSQNEFAGLQANLKKLTGQEQQIRGDLKALNQSDLRIAQLEREAELARGKYMQYSNYFEEARMDLELARERISNLSVVQAPSLQERPVSPSKMLVALGTLLLATFGTVAVVLASERLSGALITERTPSREATVRNYAPVPELRELQPARNGG